MSPKIHLIWVTKKGTIRGDTKLLKETESPLAYIKFHLQNALHCKVGKEVTVISYVKNHRHDFGDKSSCICALISIFYHTVDIHVSYSNYVMYVTTCCEHSRFSHQKSCRKLFQLGRHRQKDIQERDIRGQNSVNGMIN